MDIYIDESKALKMGNLLLSTLICLCRGRKTYCFLHGNCVLNISQYIDISINLSPISQYIDISINISPLGKIETIFIIASQSTIFAISSDLFGQNPDISVGFPQKSQ